MSKGINPKLKFSRKATRSVDQYVKGLVNRDRYVLSEVLTLIESNRPERRDIGEQILHTIAPEKHSHTIRLGITGSPGAGKSTFIESLGIFLVERGFRVAVLAIDPSSTRSQGSILGDKTRMARLSVHPDAFIRPTASANVLGGVAQATKESISVCEAAGYDVILVESVGVGQSETVLAELVDIYLLLLLPGGGDGVQGIKRGVVELADMLIINKYDGDRKLIAEQSKKDFAAAIQLFHHELWCWRVPVSLCSALENKGIGEIWRNVEKYIEKSKDVDFFINKRASQDQHWLTEQIKRHISKRAEELFALKDHLAKIDDQVSSIFLERDHAIQKIEADYQNFKSKK